MKRFCQLPCMILWIVANAVTSAAEDRAVAPLIGAHAHNDYLHERPLHDALSHGFTSVEADIFLVAGELLVAHTPLEIKPGRTLQKLYLDPLRERTRANGGQVFPSGSGFTLMIDLKTKGLETYQALSKVLASYADLLTSVENDRETVRAVSVVVSGDRPVAFISGESPRFAAIDGRLPDIYAESPRHLLPLISDNWTATFRWRGEGEMPEAERAKLQDIVTRAHSKGRRVRFWGAPDVPAIWRVQRDAKVDLINTDNLPGLEKFLRQSP